MRSPSDTGSPLPGGAGARPRSYEGEHAQAKTRLSELVAAAERGDEVVIALNGRPAVHLVAVTPERSPVRLGLLAGQSEVRDDFDEPLPEFEPYAR